MSEITVVMATYRQRKYLAKAIKSIEAQSGHRRLEVVWVWKDMKNSKDVILDYKIGNPHVWDRMSEAEKDYRANVTFDWLSDYYVKKPNMWQQRQEGLRCVYEHFRRPNDDYISFFDSDDVMLPGWLDRGLKVAKEISSRGKIPIVGPSYRMVDERLFPLQDVILPEFSMERMLEGCIIPDFSITTTEAMKSVGGLFDPDGYDVPNPCQTYGMWLRILKKYGDQVEVKLLPEIGFLYRQQKRGMHRFQIKSKKKSQENVRIQQEVARHYFEKLGDGRVKITGKL